MLWVHIPATSVEIIWKSAEKKSQTSESEVFSNATRTVSEISLIPPGPATGTSQRQRAAPRRARAPKLHEWLSQAAPPSHAGGCPLVHAIPPCAVLQWQWKRKKSKQQARLFHYLTSQSLTMALFLPSCWAAATTPAWAQLKNSTKMMPRPQRREQERPSPPGTNAPPPVQPPGWYHQRSIPQLPHTSSSPVPSPGHTARGRAPALGQLRHAARQKLIKSNWKQVDLIQWFYFLKKLGTTSKRGEEEGCTIKVNTVQGNTEAMFCMLQVFSVFFLFVCFFNVLFIKQHRRHTDWGFHLFCATLNQLKPVQ